MLLALREVGRGARHREGEQAEQNNKKKSSQAIRIILLICELQVYLGYSVLRTQSHAIKIPPNGPVGRYNLVITPFVTCITQPRANRNEGIPTTRSPRNLLPARVGTDRRFQGSS